MDASASRQHRLADLAAIRLFLQLVALVVQLAAAGQRDLDALARDPAARPARLTGPAVAVVAILFVQLVLGAWVAGLNAGYVASSWPMMNDHFVPEGIDWAGGIWLALTNDPFLIHFLHRWWSWIAAAALLLLARALSRRGAPGMARLLVAVVVAQMTLGIWTVVSGVSMWVAVMHQIMGAILVAAVATALHRLGTRTT